MKKFFALSMAFLLIAGTAFATGAQPQKKKTPTQTTSTSKSKQEPAKKQQAAPAKKQSAPAAPAAKTDYKYAVGIVAGLQYGISFKTMVQPNFTIMNDLSWDIAYTAGDLGGYQGLIDHLNLAYQAPAASGQGIDLNWYAGGGVSLGYAELGVDAMKIGANGLIGIEANMKNAPIEFTFDFRPGYGCIIVPNTWGGGATAGHVFDWQLTLGLRYTL